MSGDAGGAASGSDSSATPQANRGKTGRSALRRLFRLVLRRVRRPVVILSLTLSAALLVALFALGNSRAIVRDIFAFHPGYLLWFLGLMLVYEAGRGAQWHFLARALGIRVSLRRQALAFLAGELARSLPLGNYLPSYVLRHSDAVAYGLSSVAATAIVLFETAVALAAVVILGLGGWSGWVRLVIVGGVAITLLGSWIAWRLRRHVKLPERVLRRRSVQALLREVQTFTAGATRLVHLRVIAIGLLICAVYLTAAGAALYAVTRGLGLDVSLGQAVAVYCFSLAVGLIEPSPVDLGVIEVSGVGAFLALGVPGDQAVSAMLINRVLSIAAGLLIAGAGMVVVRREFGALRQRSRRGAGQLGM